MKYNIRMTTMRKEMNRKLQKIRSDAPHGREPLPEAEDDRLWRKCKLEWRPLLKSFAVLMLATGAAAETDIPVKPEGLLRCWTAILLRTTMFRSFIRWQL